MSFPNAIGDSQPSETTDQLPCGEPHAGVLPRPRAAWSMMCRECGHIVLFCDDCWHSWLAHVERSVEFAAVLGVVFNIQCLRCKHDARTVDEAMWVWRRS